MAVCPRCGSKAYELWTSAECTNPSCPKYVEREEAGDKSRQPKVMLPDGRVCTATAYKDFYKESSPDPEPEQRTDLEVALEALKGQPLTNVHRIGNWCCSVDLDVFLGLCGTKNQLIRTERGILAASNWRTRDSFKLVGEDVNGFGEPIHATLQFHEASRAVHRALATLEEHFAGLGGS